MNELKEKVNNVLKSIFKYIFGVITGIIITQIFTSGMITNFLFNQNIYKNFGKDVHSSPYIYVICSTIAFVSIFFYIIAVYKKIKQNNIISATLYSLFLIIMVFGTYYQIIRYTSIITSNECYKNIEIIHPYISEDKYIKLKSDLYQVNSEKTFNNVNKEIRSIANENDCKIY